MAQGVDDAKPGELEVAETERDVMDAVVLVSGRTTRRPMTLHLNEVKRDMKAIDIPTPTGGMTGVQLRGGETSRGAREPVVETPPITL